MTLLEEKDTLMVRFSLLKFPNGLLTLPIVLAPLTNLPSESLALLHSTSHINTGMTYPDFAELSESPSQEPLTPATEKVSARNLSFRVGIMVHRQSDGKSTRVNNLLSYAEVNRQVST